VTTQLKLAAQALSLVCPPRTTHWFGTQLGVPQTSAPMPQACLLTCKEVPTTLPLVSIEHFLK